MRSDIFESGSRPTNWASHHCWMEDVERLDAVIGQYLPVALSAEQDFDRALRAAYVTLKLIEMQTTLLESYLRGAQ